MDRTYTSRDLARIACAACEGCGVCCRGMGESILLDPYDADRLSKSLKKPFAEMIEHEAALIIDRGMILPHIVMREETDACSFLGADGRCQIHRDRPGICRLYPLGRTYEDDQVRYFILDGSCKVPGKVKVRISRWLEIPDIDRYERFKLEWHIFTRKIQDRLEYEEDEGEMKRINMFLIKTFYFNPYGDDFYSEFSERLDKVQRLF